MQITEGKALKLVPAETDSHYIYCVIFEIFGSMIIFDIFGSKIIFNH